MKTQRVLAAVSSMALCITLHACHQAVRHTPMKYPAAVESEYASYRAGGNSSIAGQAFLRTKGGETRRAAGLEVTLDPLTSLSAMWWDDGGAYYFLPDAAPPDAIFISARQTTTADADGRFTFSGLAPGKYLVRTIVQWLAPGLGEQGGVVGGVVEVKASETKSVIFAQEAAPLYGPAADGRATVRLTDANDPTLCIGAQDCDAKWAAGRMWITKNLTLKIQIDSPELIQTVDPGDQGAQLAARVKRQVQPDGSYKIVATMWCNNSIVCVPNPDKALKSFDTYVSSGQH